jgi:dynein heavy chain 1
LLNLQVKASRRYTLADFDGDLRTLLKRTGCDGERVCFIFDESNILDTAFLERMNALLASGEVPGLFEGDDLVALMSNVREAAGVFSLHVSFLPALVFFPFVPLFFLPEAFVCSS